MTNPHTGKESDIHNSIENLRHLATCRCDSAYTGRGLHDPQCLCDYGLEVVIVASAVAERAALSEALGGLLIALSTGKGIADATDNAKAAMCRATQGENQ